MDADDWFDAEGEGGARGGEGQGDAADDPGESWFDGGPDKPSPDSALAALQTEAVKERLDAVGAQLLPGPGPAFGKWYLNDVERWARLVREGRVQPVD